MGYRIHEKPKPKPLRNVEGTTTASTIFVQNGTIFNYAIPCLYVVADRPERAHCHNKTHHDHIGWPSPNHPDHICQSWDFAHSCCSRHTDRHRCGHCKDFLDMGLLRPIHLTKEGYDEISVSLDEAPEGVTAVGHIDDKRDWIVRIKVSSATKEALKEKVRIPYTVFASGIVSNTETKDVVARGAIVVLPGPYE